MLIPQGYLPKELFISKCPGKRVTIYDHVTAGGHFRARRRIELPDNSREGRFGWAQEC
jgi:hypothetical protein